MADETEIEVTDAMVQAAVIAMADHDDWLAECFEKGELEDIARVVRAVAGERHEARITELLEANNREVERRREVEGRLAEAKAFINAPPKHVYWGAGETDCPTDIKAGNGELHTLRCKNCGAENPLGHAICRASLSWDVPHA